EVSACGPLWFPSLFQNIIHVLYLHQVSWSVKLLLSASVIISISCCCSHRPTATGVQTCLCTMKHHLIICEQIISPLQSGSFSSSRLLLRCRFHSDSSFTGNRMA
ncbi:uncharacterized, partial [Tachysurus ichikawai]